MNILIATRQFTGGGLEQHLDILSQTLLSKGHRLTFCVSKYEPRCVPSFAAHCRMETGFRFGTGMHYSVDEFRADTERLRAIVREEKIDVISAHPAICAVTFAGVLERVPVAVTLHGDGSVNFTEYTVDTALFYQAMESVFSHIFAVSDTVAGVAGKLCGTPVSILRNPAKTQMLRRPAPDQKIWALASRLDDDAYEGICAFFDWLPSLDIDRLLVFGAGTRETELRARAAQTGADKKIEWRGYDVNWLSASGGCYGVVGACRTAIEAMAAGYPVLLLHSAGNPCGLVDAAVYARGREQNFSDRYLEPLADIAGLQQQLEKCYRDPAPYLMYGNAALDYAAEAVCADFTEHIETLQPRPCAIFERFYASLDEVGGSLPLFTSFAVFEKLRDTFNYMNILPAVKALLVSANELYSVEQSKQTLEAIEASTTWRVSLGLQKAAQRLGLDRLKRRFGSK
ncbi:MAG: glycosyltransferase [Oscillospiraceae bacterium]|nr:glycosyltransferase [Oscillospiraceae bacterium]